MAFAIKDYKKEGNRAYTFTLKKLRQDLSRLNLDEDLRYALQVTKMKLRIEIDLNSNPFVTLHDENTGEKMGSIVDLERIARLSDIVREGKKVLQSANILEDMEKYLVSYIQTLSDEDFVKFKRLGKLEPFSVGRLKQLLPKLRMLEVNNEYAKKFSVRANSDESNCGKMLASWVKLSYDVVLAEIHDLFFQRGEKFSKKATMYKIGLPEFGYNKVTQTMLSAQSDVRRTIFPQTLKGNFSLTMREILHHSMVEDHKWLLQYSGAIIDFVGSEPMMQKYLHRDFRLNRQITEQMPDGSKIPSYNLEGKAKKALDVPIQMVPIMFDAHFTFAPHATGKPCRVPARTDLSFEEVYLPNDFAVFSILTTYIRAVTFNVPIVNVKQNFWGPLLGIKKIKIDFLEKTNNIFETMLSGNPSQGILDSIREFYTAGSKAHRQILLALMNYELQLPETSPVLKDIKKWLKTDVESRTQTSRGLIRDVGSTYRTTFDTPVAEVYDSDGFKTLNRMKVSDPSKDGWVEHIRHRVTEPALKLPAHFKRNKKGEKPTPRVRMDLVTAAAKKELRRVSELPYLRGLASHLEEWIADFSPGRIQDAAVVHLKNYVEGLEYAINRDLVDTPVFKIAEEDEQANDWGDEEYPQLGITPVDDDEDEINIPTVAGTTEDDLWDQL